MLGFTNHDRDIIVETVSCTARSGFDSSEAVSDLGLTIDNQEISGALDAETISAADLRRGKYDSAKVETWLVNWKQPEERQLLQVSLLGEVSQNENHFFAELRGLTSVLDQPIGRVYSRTCDAVLGDERCKFNLANSAYKGFGYVTEVIGPRSVAISGLSQLTHGWFSLGNLTWTTGSNSGTHSEIQSTGGSQNDQLVLWQAPGSQIAVGDHFEVTAGCDKSFAACRFKFANQTNFRGCPHMPGSDFVLGYVDKQSVHDGSPLVY